MRDEDVEEVLEGIVEDDFVVLPGMYRAEFGGELEVGVECLFGVQRPGVQFDVVVAGDAFFAGLGDEVEADLDFEFAPSVREYQ